MYPVLNWPGGTPLPKPKASSPPLLGPYRSWGSRGEVATPELPSNMVGDPRGVFVSQPGEMFEGKRTSQFKGP